MHFERVPKLWSLRTKNSLNPGRQILDGYNQRFMLQIVFADCPRLSAKISAQFTVEICAVSWNREKDYYKLAFGLNFTSFKVLNVGIPKSSSVVFVMISSNSIAIWTFFTLTSNLSKTHETRASLAVPVRRLFWSISIHFVAIHSWNLHAPQPQMA